MGRESVPDGSIPGCFLPKPCFSEGCFPPLLTLPCTPPVGSQGETAWAPLAIWGTSTARAFCCIPSLRPGALYGAISPSVCFPLMQGPLGEGSLPLGHGAEVAVMPPGGGRRGGGSCPIQHPAINRGRRAVICSINTAPRLVSHRWERRGAEKPRARRGGGPPAAWERGEEGFQHLPPNARCCRAALAARLWLMHPILLALQRRSVPRQTGTPGSPPARRCLFASLR